MKLIKKIIFLLLGLVLFTCSKDEKEKQYEDLNLIVASNSVMPLEFVVLTSESYSFTEETYLAKFGDQQINVMLNQTGELVFPVPNVEQGNYQFELIVGDSKGVVDFSVNPHNIVHTQVVLEEELLLPLKEFNQVSLSFIGEGNLSNDVLNQLYVANNMYNEFLNKLSMLSEDEKLEMAMFFRANPILTASLNAAKQMGKKSVKANVTDCFKKNADILIATTAFVLAAYPILTAALTPPATLLGVMGLVVTSVGAVAIIAAAQERLLNDCFIPYENLFKDSNGNVNDFEFDDEITKKLSVWYKLRNLISSDTNNENVIIKKVAEKWSVLTSIFESFKLKLNRIISTTSNWFTSWFSSGESFNEITIDISELPATSEEYEVEGDYYTNITTTGVPEGIAYEVVNNDGSLNTVDYKFIALDKSLLPITFQVRTNYFDGDIEYDSEFRVHLKAAVDSIPIYMEHLVGVWEVGKPSGQILDLELNSANGSNTSTGRYKEQIDMRNPPRWYSMNWKVTKAKDGRYYFYESGFWHYAIPNIYQPLSYPVTQFTRYSDTEKSQILAVYKRN